MNAVTTDSVRPAGRGFGSALAAGWVALATAAWGFARLRHIPATIAIPLALAFLTEYSFYLLLGFAKVRSYLAGRFTRMQIVAGILFSALLPYLTFSVGMRSFGLTALAWLAIETAIAFWFVFPPRGRVLAGFRDLAFLAFLAFVILSGVLRWIFPAPLPKLPLEVLGHVTLIRSGILAVLFLRHCEETGIGFIPRGRDLAIGAFWFLVCALIATPVGIRLGQLHLSSRTLAFWPSLGLILGVFWVLALSEEFFFRGLLQQWLSRWTNNRGVGLILGAVLFAACHLGFRGAFPNWRMAVLSLILGLSCGAAFLQARSIRASMVTHALAVGAWRLLLS